jgi:DNA-binding SARP family transcriptional activator
VEIRLLGPVEVHAGGTVLAKGRPQQQVVLAALAEHAGRVVSTERLVDQVWGQRPPPRAGRALHAHIARIRRMVEQAESTGDVSARVVRHGSGYLLEVEPERVDLHEFSRLVRQGRAPEHDAKDRAWLLGRALGLWRGEPLAGLSGLWTQQRRQVWRLQRLDAVLLWAEAEFATGDPTAVIATLTEEVAEHPLVEPLVVLLMKALAATGRGAEALHCYVAMRRRLAEALGADPGPALQETHLAVLRGKRISPAVPVAAAPHAV